MKILITGATGFIGLFLVKDCSQRGYQVKCLVRKTSNVDKLKKYPIKLIYGDLLDKDSLVEAVKDIDVIYHLAAETGKVAKEIYDKINCLGTRNLAETSLAYNQNLKRFVHISSIAAVGPTKTNLPRIEEDIPEPINDYGRSKLEAENCIKELKGKLPYTIVRLPAVYGPGDRNLMKFIKLAKIGIWPSFFSKGSLTSFIYVDDVVGGLNLIATSLQSLNQTYFLTEEKFYTLKEIGNIIAEALGKNLIIIKTSKNLLIFLVSLQEVIFKLINKKPFIFSSQIERWASQNWICSGQKVKKELGFETKISLREGIKELIK